MIASRPVAQAEDEVAVAEVGVVAHDVPQDRPVADRDHRLGDRLAVLAQAQPAAPAEQDDLHRRLTRSASRLGWRRRGGLPTRGCSSSWRAISSRRFHGRIRITSGRVSARRDGSMDRDARPWREPAVLVRVPVDRVVEEVRPDPAVVQERVALARRAVAGDREPGPACLDEERQAARALSHATRSSNPA